MYILRRLLLHLHVLLHMLRHYVHGLHLHLCHWDLIGPVDRLGLPVRRL